MATSEIGKGGAGRSAGLGDLLFEEREEIAGMESVANLMPEAVEANIFERTSLAESMDPVTEDALSWVGELTGSAHDTAAIDPNRKSAHRAIFNREVFACDFCGAVEGCGRNGRERLGSTDGGESGGKGRRVNGFVSVKTGPERARRRIRGPYLNVELSEGGDGVNAAGGEEDEAGCVSAAVFEEVHGTSEVVLDELTCARPAIDAGEDGGIGGSVDDVVASRQCFEVRGVADVPAVKFHTELLFNEGAVSL